MGDEGGFDDLDNIGPEQVSGIVGERDRTMRMIEAAGIDPAIALIALVDQARLAASFRYKDMIEPPETIQAFEAAIREADRFGLPSNEVQDIAAANSALSLLSENLPRLDVDSAVRIKQIEAAGIDPRTALKSLVMVAAMAAGLRLSQFNLPVTEAETNAVIRSLDGFRIDPHDQEIVRKIAGPLKDLQSILQ